jgi:uncharacterized protein (DUF2267 family)
MSDHLTIPQLRRTTQITQEWLDDLAARAPFQGEDQAYSVLRAVLHAVRDRLTAEEAAHLASHLPMLVRGFYWEGWRPALAPNDFDTADAFYGRIEDSLRVSPMGDGVDLPSATKATLEFLTDRVDAGEIRHVAQQLPPDIEALFPVSVRA